MSTREPTSTSRSAEDKLYHGRLADVAGGVGGAALVVSRREEVAETRDIEKCGAQESLVEARSPFLLTPAMSTANDSNGV